MMAGLMAARWRLCPPAVRVANPRWFRRLSTTVPTSIRPTTPVETEDLSAAISRLNLWETDGATPVHVGVAIDGSAAGVATALLTAKSCPPGGKITWLFCRAENAAQPNCGAEHGDSDGADPTPTVSEVHNSLETFRTKIRPETVGIAHIDIPKDNTRAELLPVKRSYKHFIQSCTAPAVELGIHRLLLPDTQLIQMAHFLRRVSDLSMPYAALAFLGEREDINKYACGIPSGVVELVRPFTDVAEDKIETLCRNYGAIFRKLPANEVTKKELRGTIEALRTLPALHASLSKLGTNLRRIELDIESAVARTIRSSVVHTGSSGHLIVRRPGLANAPTKEIGLLAVHRMSQFVSGDIQHRANVASFLRLYDDIRKLGPQIQSGVTISGAYFRVVDPKRLADYYAGVKHPRRGFQSRQVTNVPCGEFLQVVREAGVVRRRTLFMDVGETIFFDRYVITIQPRGGSSLDVSDRRIALETLRGMGRGHYRDTVSRTKEFQIRTMSKDDWVGLGVTVPRSRRAPLPHQVKMSLPVVADRAGEVVAVPHLGVNFRDDLKISIILMPIHRCLPPDVDPGYDVPALSYLHEPPGAFGDVANTGI